MSRKRVLAAATNGSRPGVKAVLSFRKADGNVPLCDGFQKKTIQTAKTNMLFSILFLQHGLDQFPRTISEYFFLCLCIESHAQASKNGFK